MALALTLDGMTPLFLHMVPNPFQLWHASIQRKVTVKSSEL
jgi:hypothetical protein